jgi:hypothetical protein
MLWHAGLLDENLDKTVSISSLCSSMFVHFCSVRICYAITSQSTFQLL